jgi:hypothetical protein
MGCSATGEPRPRADWARAAEGLQLAGFAVFLLLNTTGVLPWSFWIDAISLWPVLIMSAGVKVAFAKSRAPWLLLLGPVLVLGSLAWLASGRRPEAPPGPWETAVLPRSADATKLEIEAGLAGARLRLARATDLPDDRLVDGRSRRRSDRTRLDARTEDGVARVRLDGGRRHGIVFLPRAREDWDLRLPAALPLRVRIRGAGVGGDLDLTGGTLEGLHAEGVFIGVDARLPAPREETDLRMKGVFNSLSLSVPEGTPVSVKGAGLPFNAVDRGVRGAEGRPGYRVQVEGIFSAVEVRTDRAISPGPPPPPVSPSPAPTPRPPAEAPPSAG